ncbi:HNH endonuclease signature motif containing protein [Nocardioides coralli]|uniref:HNH endonuclease signature motif containing protein n=1 Tax=Nocardioides coralli TaxID=2872154 RepID=UPI001CA3E47C|nr:HNH endonuclease signature motif containing protein [Nocardioides coralli]QZY28413.1 HNH endonuclease [Nocardioides coralli]
MSSVLELDALASGHPAAVVAAVHEALDTAVVEGIADGEYAGVIRELARARSRLHALELKLVAAATKARVPQQSGARSTGAWVAQQTRTSGAQAAREAGLAHDLHHKLPATATAFGAGAVSAEHAGVIAHAVGHLPRTLTPAQRETVERDLVAKAARLDPQQLRRAARRALAAVEPDPATVDAHENAQLVEEESAAWARTRFTLHDNGDGTSTGHFTVPTLAATILKKAVDQLASPRRGRLGATTAQAGRSPSPAAEGFDWARRHGEAFTSLLERLPTDHLHRKVAATVIVTLDADTLTGRLKAAGLDTGDLVSAAEARRLACQAGILPAVLDGASQLLDLGRRNRFFTDTQATAGALHHTSCAADGCDVPYAWTELHHRQPWSHGGTTDLDQMIPLCGFHHRRIHDPGHLHRRLPDGSIRFSRRT